MCLYFCGCVVSLNDGILLKLSIWGFSEGREIWVFFLYCGLDFESCSYGLVL